MEEKVVVENVSSSDNADTASSKKRREEKIRKRDPKAWENIFKTLSALPESDKIETISKKYSELYDEFRKVSQNCQNLDKSCTLLQKEKEHTRSEQAKSILARSRLENLCRELQKQNKQIKEENITKLKEEEERRKEVASKFQKTLDELTSVMNENRDRNFKLRDDNIDMSKKISELYSEFQKREEDIKRMTKQMELEKQLAKATITKLEFELKAERELWSKERDILQKNLEQSETRNQQLLEKIQGMEEHLSIYKGQYEDFESTLDKSNKIFDNCKSEMVKMSKHTVALEKEVNIWKAKWQSSTASLIELSTAKQTQDMHLVAADKKIEQLQKLCRQLQVDRGAFLKLLKANGIEPVSQTCVENAEKPPTPKERELVILKDSLKMLQEQLQDQLKSVPNNESGEQNESDAERCIQDPSMVDSVNSSSEVVNNIQEEAHNSSCVDGIPNEPISNSALVVESLTSLDDVNKSTSCETPDSCTGNIPSQSVSDGDCLIQEESVQVSSSNVGHCGTIRKEDTSVMKNNTEVDKVDTIMSVPLNNENELQHNVDEVAKTVDSSAIQLEENGGLLNENKNGVCSIADQKVEVTVLE